MTSCHTKWLCVLLHLSVFLALQIEIEGQGYVVTRLELTFKVS
jgi:hypothetical protein